MKISSNRLLIELSYRDKDDWKIQRILMNLLVRKSLSPCFFKKIEKYSMIENWPLKQINQSLLMISEVFERWFTGNTELDPKQNCSYLSLFEEYILDKQWSILSFWESIFIGKKNSQNILIWQI